VGGVMGEDQGSQWRGWGHRKKVGEGDKVTHREEWVGSYGRRLILMG